MDLPNLFSANSNKNDQVMVIFVLITEIKVKSFLLLISNEGSEVLDSSEVMDYDGTRNALVIVDESLQQLGKESESVDSVIFGLNHDWVKNGEVVKEKKPLLKKLTDELSLKPMGFIVISEAVVQQRISRNSMFSGIVSVLSKDNLTLTLVHQGKVKAIESVGRSSDGKGDFLEGLARFSTKSERDGFYLPTRIILVSVDLDEGELRKHQQLIYDSDWKNQKQFLQPPTVEVMLKKDFEEMVTKEAAKAVALQKGMTQAAMAATVVGATDNLKESNVDISQTTKLDSGEMGFNDVSISEKASQASSFGVPISTDDFDKELIKDVGRKSSEPDFEENSELAVDFSDSKAKKSDKKKNAIQSLIEVAGKKNPAVGKKHYKNFKMYAMVGFFTGLLALLVIGFFGINSLAKANISINLKSEPVFKDLEITLDTSASETDAENLVLAADKITKTKQSESTIQTTGIKIVGDEAKGRVAVYNNTVAEKTFAKGTVLTVGELQFELDEDVTVASAETDLSSGSSKFGRKDANVTALQIGADSNISEGTEMTIVPFDKSSYYALVIDDGFSGGASREVKVVSEDDRYELLIDLRKEMVEELNNEFAAEAGDGVYILPSNNIISENAVFSFEVGNEAEELSLILDIELEAVTYTAEDLKPLAAEILASEIPDGHLLSDQDPQILSAPTESDLELLDADEPVTLSANISSFAIPDLSIDFLKNDIAGKKLDDAMSLLESMSEIESAEISISPGFARLITKKVPTSLERILIEFESEE